jgi:hypothetical protein
VLLNVALMCATPSASTTFLLRFRGGVASANRISALVEVGAFWGSHSV